MKQGQKLVAKNAKKCVYCGEVFNSARKDAKTCSTICRNAVSIRNKKISLPYKSIIFNTPSLWDMITSGLKEHHIKFILKKRSVAKLKKFIAISKNLGFRSLSHAIDVYGLEFKENVKDCKLNFDPKKYENLKPKPNFFGTSLPGMLLNNLANSDPNQPKKYFPSAPPES